MGIRIPVEDSAPLVAFEDAVASVFEALGEVPEFRDPRGKQIELKGTLGLAIVAMTTRPSRTRAAPATWATVARRSGPAAPARYSTGTRISRGFTGQ